MEIDCSIRVLAGRDVTLSPDDMVEISLDCSECGASDQTIELTSSGAQCRKNAHPYRGRVLGREVRDCGEWSSEDRAGRCVQVVYRLQVTDGAELPLWGRVTFECLCPVSETRQEESVQTNVSRPYEASCEVCGFVLFVDTEEQPSFTA